MPRILTCLFALSCFLCTPALAQNEPPPDAEEPAPNVRYKDKTEIIFGGIDVDADVAKPFGYFDIGGLPDREKKPLVELRPDFNREMRASVDAMK